jgi:adenylyl- and sulfurtransferase ThiI
MFQRIFYLLVEGLGQVSSQTFFSLADLNQAIVPLLEAEPVVSVF